MQEQPIAAHLNDHDRFASHALEMGEVSARIFKYFIPFNNLSMSMCFAGSDHPIIVLES